MGQSRESVHEFTLATLTSTRIWDAPTSQPIKNMYIYITSRGAALPAGACTWEMFYGGGWDNTPFADGTTHIGGVSQGAAAALVLGVEMAELLYTDTNFIPANAHPATPPAPAQQPWGFPLVLELDNTGGTDLDLTVVFLSQVVSDRY